MKKNVLSLASAFAASLMMAGGGMPHVGRVPRIPRRTFRLSRSFDKFTQAEKFARRLARCVNDTAMWQRQQQNAVRWGHRSS